MHMHAYEASQDLPTCTRRKADDEMIERLTSTRKNAQKRWQERADAGLVEAAMRSSAGQGGERSAVTAVTIVVTDKLTYRVNSRCRSAVVSVVGPGS